MLCRYASFMALLFLLGCGGGGSDPSVNRPYIVSVLRYTPTSLVGSLSHPFLSFGYIDAGRSNGLFPSIEDFRSSFDALNPNLLSGSCSAIATLSVGNIFATALTPDIGPTIIVAFYPRALGSCKQTFRIPGAADIQMTYEVQP